MTVKSHKKLIEVALPLEAINKASAREKSIRHGHPSTLHPWWARRPLAAARAVIFAQMVDDPSASPDLFPTEKKQEKERQRLFKIIEDLVLWDNTTNEKVLQAARDEIWQSWRRACAENADHPRAKDLFDRKKLPGFHDPFAGGGALPLEAQRLGLESFASDLNPVAVLINKAMIEIPPKFAGRPPVNPDWRKNSKQEQSLTQWSGSRGLAEDLRYYGQWMRDEAEKHIGQLYPQIEITAEMTKERPDLKKLVGQKLTVIAWLWARTVKSPNPAFRDVDVPLASTFMLSTKSGKEVYVEPVIENGGYRFLVKVGKPKNAEAAQEGTKLSRGANFRCVMSDTPIAQDHIRKEFTAKRAGERLMAIVADGGRERVYLSPTDAMEAVARSAKPKWKPDVEMNQDCKDLLSGRGYGFKSWHELFTSRQLVALTTFSNLIEKAREQAKSAAIAACLPNDGKPLSSGGTGADAYADAIAAYLGLIVSKQSIFLVTQARWRAGEGKSAPAFGRQALPMVWDFAELNPFAGAGGDFLGIVDGAVKTLLNCPPPTKGVVEQADAATQMLSSDHIVSTDPPYYDNISYADLSDFFYIWLRGSLKSVFPSLFSTVAVPKADELVASAFRHGGRDKAETFFLEGMTRAMHRLADQAHPAFPVTIYYAFKQSETNDGEGTSSTGWDTFLDAVIRAGFAITGTWPMRTENQTRLVGMVTNALASSIVLVCRKRASDAATATRREFVTALKQELANAVRHLQAGFIAPVDLAQAAIGPGMAVFTRYAKVLDAEGKPITVREALALINQTLDEALAEQEGDYDADSRWALAWFEQYGFSEGEFGVAETLTKAKNTSVEGLVEAGILASKRGKVRLLAPDELPEDWDPDTDNRLTNWETVHHLIRVLGSGGESAASELVSKLGSNAEPARELAYRLYALCERKKRATDALAYNGLVQSWPELIRLAQQGGKTKAAEKQATMFSEKE
jgi:putative DNA methylase